MRQKEPRPEGKCVVSRFPAPFTPDDGGGRRKVSGAAPKGKPRHALVAG
jgi:hypothetical protein